MKKLLLALAVMLISAASAKASEVPIDIRVNGEYIVTDTEPVIISGRTYAPLRAIADALGAESVEWKNGTANVNIDSKTVSVRIGSKTAYVNGKAVAMSNAAFLHNDRTLVPVRAMSDIFGAKVGWDDEYKNVELTKTTTVVPHSMIDRTFTHDELYWLSRIINAESRGESMRGKIAVGDVILNRVKSPLFPNTIYGVIFDRKYAVQFEPVINGSIYHSPTAESVGAAKLSLNSPSTVGECLYFFNPITASNSWIAQNRPYYTTIGGHVFYL